MGGFAEYHRYDGLGLAELVKRKEVTPAELCEEAIARIEKVNPRLNAVVTPMFEIGRELAHRIDPESPFAGVPFLLKDLLHDYAGVPQKRGSKAYRDNVSSQDSELVTRFKRSGLVTLGKTNIPEFGLMGVTESELHGPARNPWDTNRTPGGSSGGSAAAVAGGMVPLASGTDGGGSIRIPASCCGLFGLKVSRGRTPTGPEHGAIWQGAVVDHVITRSVRDSAAVLDTTQGAETGSPYIIAPPERPYLKEIQQAPISLRIAVSTRSPIDTPVHPECQKAVDQTARLLEQLGHHVEEAEPTLDGHALAQSFMALYFGEVAADLEELRSHLGRKAKPSEVEPLTWMLGLLGRTYSAGYFVSMRREWDKAARVMGRFHETYDLYLTPTLAYPPVNIGELQPKPVEKILIRIVNSLGLGGLVKASGVVDKLAVDNMSKVPFTELANFTGQPAMSIPLYWTPEGLPCGSHFMAPFGDEATLFRLAAQLEAAQPWFDRQPPVFALP
jgi:amidase